MVIHAVQATLLRVGHVQSLLGARYADIAQPPLFLEPAWVGDGALMRK